MPETDCQPRRPLRTMFLLSSMPVGGAETLLVNLVRGFDRTRIEPLVGCLKQKDVLGQRLAEEIPVFDRLIEHKYDFRVIRRLKNIFLEQSVDAVITVGAGDKMFWGRLAARQARLPVVLSALHSTGWPDGVGRLNRMLTGITDGFIAVASQHAEYLIEAEGFPSSKVFLIPNGIDTRHFQLDLEQRQQWRKRLNIAPQAPVVGIVAALRPEKNHRLFLEVARRVAQQAADAEFVIAGDGPAREELVAVAEEFGIDQRVHFLGSVDNVVGVLSMLDLFALTSDNEASPVSIMEALSCQRPVVATDVGSISETVRAGENGLLVPVGDADRMAEGWLEILGNPELRKSMGELGRKHVVHSSSLDRMIEGYTELIEGCYHRKQRRVQNAQLSPATADAVAAIPMSTNPSTSPSKN